MKNVSVNMSTFAVKSAYVVTTEDDYNILLRNDPYLRGNNTSYPKIKLH
jgi:hypothetical protein